MHLCPSPAAPGTGQPVLSPCSPATPLPFRLRAARSDSRGVGLQDVTHLRGRHGCGALWVGQERARHRAASGCGLQRGPRHGHPLAGAAGARWQAGQAGQKGRASAAGLELGACTAGRASCPSCCMGWRRGRAACGRHFARRHVCMAVWGWPEGYALLQPRVEHHAVVWAHAPCSLPSTRRWTPPPPRAPPAPATHTTTTTTHPPLSRCTT